MLATGCIEYSLVKDEMIMFLLYMSFVDADILKKEIQKSQILAFNFMILMILMLCIMMEA